jgi:hypothetical protein
MPESYAAQVRQAVRAIREFHALGRQVPPKTSLKEAYGEGVVAELAGRWGTNEDKVRKARTFADPRAGFTAAELDELCRLIEDVQSRFGEEDKDKYVFRRSHLIRLLSVRPKRRRKTLQERAIKAGWSKSRLEAEIARRFGTRRTGGRMPDPAETLETWLAQTEGLCETWRRWSAALDVRDAKVRVTRQDLPSEVSRTFRDITTAIGSFQKMLLEEMSRRTRDRQPRFAVGG